MTRKRYPSDVQLAYDGRRWVLTFGAYRIEIRACHCSLPPCLCRRPPARRWARPDSHARNNCHLGHAEHVAVLFRKAVGTVRHAQP
jgi:hypothetical protein